MVRLVLLANLSSRGLLLHRNPARGWELPGGKAESGESDEDAVLREASEEVGWQPSALLARRTISLDGREAVLFISSEEPPSRLSGFVFSEPPEWIAFGKDEFLQALSMAREAVAEANER